MTQITVDRLTLLLQISQLFNSTLDLEEVLNLVIDQVIVALRAERGIVLLFDEDRNLQVRVARGVDRQTLESPEFEFSRSIVERVAQEGQPQLTSDAQDDRWLSQRESVLSLGLRSVLCVPLHVKRSQIGVIYVDNRLQAGVFMPAELDLLTTIAASAATAIENARLYEIAVERGRLERELQLARALQASFIPASAPQIEGWDIAARWYPAHEVSGDFYDFLKTEEDGLGVAIADVSDKGMGAALFMVLARTVLRSSIEGATSPAAAISRSNRLLYSDANDGMFVTLFYCDLDPQNGILRYVNAGHNPPLLFRVGETEPELLERTGILLGVDEQADFNQQLLQLNSGDLIFLYTDGIFDAHNSEMIPFGLNRVQELLQAHRNAPAEEILQTLMTAIQKFTGKAPSFDDITLVILKRL